jgi:hypothetical protein
MWTGRILRANANIICCAEDSADNAAFAAAVPARAEVRWRVHILKAALELEACETKRTEVAIRMVDRLERAPRNFEEMLLSPHWRAWMKALNEEADKLNEYNTLRLCKRREAWNVRKHAAPCIEVNVYKWLPSGEFDRAKHRGFVLGAISRAKPLATLRILLRQQFRRKASDFLWHVRF